MTSAFVSFIVLVGLGMAVVIIAFGAWLWEQRSPSRQYLQAGAGAVDAFARGVAQAAQAQTQAFPLVDPLTVAELSRAGLDHGAESFAAHPGMFREVGGLDVRSDEQRRADEWRDRFNDAIRDVNKRFDALVADLPDSEDDPLPAGYWPEVAPVTGAGAPVTTEHLARALGPTGMLAYIEARNETPQVFSWSTGAYPVVIPGETATAELWPVPVVPGRKHRR